MQVRRLGSITVAGPLHLGKVAVIVHGGAGSWRAVERDIQEALEWAKRAAEAGLGYNEPLQGVAASIEVLENSGVFNAGVGSTLTYTGRVEMDAGLMDDKLHSGAVAVVTYPKNPIRLAEYVAAKLDHIIIAGSAADELARRLGLEPHPGPSERALRRWRELREKLRHGEGPAWARSVASLYGDTVGAVVAYRGRVAAGASTGGIALKHPGRIGDSPVPGAGFYAEKGVGACSATGIGETILLGRPCMFALHLMLQGVPVDKAAEAAVARHTRMFGSDNLGLILLDVEGNAAAAMNTRAMPVALAGDSQEARSLLLLR
ncbi:MAG: isoaspartyl peptidase/L-asparaginase [Thermoproteota archaeon]